MSFCIQGQPGALDLTFNTGTGASNKVISIALQPDGKVLIGGQFNSFNGIPTIRIARLNPDGTLDETFNTGTGANFEVLSIALQTDGKILIGGQFTSFSGIPANRIVRLNPDGTVDETFNTGTGADGGVTSIALQPDEKVLIGGWFTSFNGNPANRIVRLNPDGTLDDTFDTSIGASNNVRAIGIQPDGKILIGGWFTSYNGIPANRIARLNPDGTLDDTFNTGTGASDWIDTIALQSDGKALIGGWFTTYNQISAKRIARLNTDGTLDDTFNTGTGVNTNVSQCITLQANGKVLIVGSFYYFNGITVNRIARLNPDGTLDNTFDTGTGANSLVSSVALQPDGKILIGGWFESFNGTTANRIARLHGDVVTQIPKHSNGHSLTVYPNPLKHQVEILTADNFSGSDYHWEVMDVNGRVFTPLVILSSKERLILDFENITNGVYIIRLTDGNRSYTTRVVKE